jgi:hypothetical protein
MIGSNNVADYRITDSALDSCMAAGVMLSNYTGFGWGDNASISAEIRDNTITGQAYAGVDFYNSGTLRSVEIEGSRNDIERSGHYGLAFDDYSAGATGAQIDFGGGPLHSSGRNRIVDSGAGAAAVQNLAVVAERNWWGDPSGPQGVSLTGTATLDATPFLPRDPER